MEMPWLDVRDSSERSDDEMSNGSLGDLRQLEKVVMIEPGLLEIE